MYFNSSLKHYLEDLAAKKPAPGGGSAAALTAALGVSLISMVINFTLGKPKYAKYESELRSSLERFEKLRADFLNLVDLDVVAYKSKNVEEALKVPLKVCDFSLEAINLCPPLIQKGNVNLISDVAVAAVLLEAGFTAAYFNVEINLKNLQDARYVAQARKELAQKKNAVTKVRKQVEGKVGKIIRG